MKGSTLSMPVESSNRLALITPSLFPRDAPISSPSPISMDLQKSSPLPITMPEVEIISEDPVKPEEKSGASPPSSPKSTNTTTTPKKTHPRTRVNKFVRRLHDMLQAEKGSGIVEWRRGLLVLHSTDAFTKTILPRYFNTKNFKTLRRQLNYYGFVHVRSFSTTGSTTTALWVNRDLAKRGSDDISSVLMLKRVEPCDTAKTAEGRRMRKELAVSTVEDDIGVSAKSLQLEQIRFMALRQADIEDSSFDLPPSIPLVVHCHGVNHSTTTTLLEGGPLTAPTFPKTTATTTTSWFTSQNHTVTDDTGESSDSSQCSDAANLLLAFSKSTVPTSSFL
jgi:hypothetical protein